jgi:hypothetical protein
MEHDRTQVRDAAERDRVRPPRAKPMARSKVSNGAKLLAGVDGRSAVARRLRDILYGLTVEFEINSESDHVLVKQAAVLTILSEELQAKVVRGELIDHKAILNLAGQLRRTLATLRARAGQRGPAPPSIHEHLSTFGHRTNDDYDEEFLADAEGDAD